MEWIVQFLMAIGDQAAFLFISRDSPNFEVVQGMLAVVALAACVMLVAFLLRQKK